MLEEKFTIVNIHQGENKSNKSIKSLFKSVEKTNYKNIENYSPKIKLLLDYIKKSEGIVLIYSKYISLPNILSEKKIVNELLQTQVNLNNLIHELDTLMKDDLGEMKKNFEILHNSLINDNESKFFSVIKLL